MTISDEELDKKADQVRRKWVYRATRQFMDREPTEDEVEVLGRGAFSEGYQAGYRQAEQDQGAKIKKAREGLSKIVKNAGPSFDPDFDQDASIAKQALKELEE